MEEKKELHYCEKCKTETWFTTSQIRKRGNICPNGCPRNFLIFLGTEEKEIAKRRKEFLEKDTFDFEVNPDIEDMEEYIRGEGRRYSYSADDTGLGLD